MSVADVLISQLDQALRTLEDCRTEAESAMRQAGRAACAELTFAPEPGFLDLLRKWP